MIVFTPGSTNRKTFKEFLTTPRKIKKGARKGFYLNGKMLVQDVREKMTKGPKSGNTYLIYRGLGGRLLKRPRLHIASRPSEYPAIISGNLRKSVDFKVRGHSRMEFGAGDGSMIYAKTLEKRNKYLRRTIASSRNIFKTTMNREINKSLGIYKNAS